LQRVGDYVRDTGVRARGVQAWLAVLVLIGGAGCRGEQAQPPVGNAGAADGVSMRTLALVDTSRATTDRRRGTGSAGRTITTHVYFPTGGSGPYPVVVFSHGLRGTPDDYRGLLTQWARDGFVVVAPVYPLTSRDSQEVVPGDLVNQPADASFALSQVLNNAEFKSTADGQHVAAAGHSEGALTTYGLFTACCRDARLVAGIVMAGDAVGFRDQPLTGSATPMLFIHGDADPLVPIVAGQAAYARVPWPKGFLTLTGAAHIPPYLGGDNPDAQLVASTTSAFLRWTLRADPAALAALRRDAATSSIAHFDDHFN
jgi:fermentation-respiration switch protein FrsA (DUF1100 family)